MLQVQPPFTNKEVIMIFMNMLCDPYYDKLMGNATLNFNDLVTFDEMIEYAIKSGMIDVKGKEKGVVQENKETQPVFLGSQRSGGPLRSTPYYYQLPRKAYSLIRIVSPDVML